jgi:hypothetical protein
VLASVPVLGPLLLLLLLLLLLWRQLRCQR